MSDIVVEDLTPGTDIDKSTVTKMTETATRSCAKAIGWRIVATGTTIVVSYFYLDDISKASEIGAIDFVGKLILHYLYERCFSKITWGYTEKTVRV